MHVSEEFFRFEGILDGAVLDYDVEIVEGEINALVYDCITAQMVWRGKNFSSFDAAETEALTMIELLETQKGFGLVLV
jgi:hypothetical protein